MLPETEPTNLCLLINLQGVDAGVQSRDLRNVVIFTFALLLLQLKGDTSDRTLLDTLHQMGGEASDLVA